LTGKLNQYRATTLNITEGIIALNCDVEGKENVLLAQPHGSLQSHTHQQRNKHEHNVVAGEGDETKKLTCRQLLFPSFRWLCLSPPRPKRLAGDGPHESQFFLHFFENEQTVNSSIAAMKRLTVRISNIFGVENY
jgi:hypothetical protein